MPKTLGVVSCFFALLTPCVALADVDCVFHPSVVKAGEFGNDDDKLFVCDETVWGCYNLGIGSDAQARNRHTIAMSALLSGKQVLLRFWGETSCTNAQQKKTVPNSTWIKNK
jgi:hypothetical protein